MVGHETTVGTLSFSPPKSCLNRIRCQQDTLRYDCYRSAYTIKSLHMDATGGTMMCKSSSGSFRSSKVSLPYACLLSIPNLRILYYFPSFLTSHSFPTSSTRLSRPYPLLARTSIFWKSIPHSEPNQSNTHLQTPPPPVLPTNHLLNA